MPRKPPKTPSFPSLILFLSMASLLALLLLLPLRPQPTTATAAAAGDSSLTVLLACNATLFPASCLTALSSSPLPSSPTPSDLILAALAASSSTLPTIPPLLRPLLPSPTHSTAARNCLAHLFLSSRRLSTAGSSLPDLPTSRALASAALLYQYDCWSALKYVNTTASVAAIMSQLISLTHLTSNALAMLQSYKRFGADVSSWVSPQTERDGYWGDSDNINTNTNTDPVPRFGGNPAPDVTVCSAGCDCTTVQSAVDSAPEFGTGRFVIYIKAGVYKETVRVPFEKTNVVFLGDGMGKTVISGSLNAQMAGVTTYNTATVGVAGDGFMARGVTFENTAGAGEHQAVAFMSDSDRSILESVEIAGHQDSLYARSLRHLYRNCRISGTVDFIFGNAAAVFEECTLLVVPRLGTPEKGESNAVTAQGRTDPGQATGFVFSNCTVDGSDEYLALYRARPGRHKVYLGRPWKEYSRTVFLGCYMGKIVRPEGWLPWRGEFALATLFYGEFGNSGSGANETGRVGWSSRIPEEHVGVYSLRSFIQGDEWIFTNQ